MLKVDVTTGSRLHFGLICGTKSTGWEFGGIGMMLRKPGWRLSLVSGPSENDQITASPHTATRIREFLKAIRHTTSLQTIHLAVTEEVPFHTGLGGGTQLGLAIAAAAQLLTNQNAVNDPYLLASLANRAERSAIGTAGFRDGGFLIDHGFSVEPESARRVDRIAIPEEWRFLIVRPLEAQGLSGDRERNFFNQKKLMPPTLVQQLSEQISHRIAPAIQHQQFEQFATSLESYGRAVGQFYATEQGDIFAHPSIRKLAAELAAQGVDGTAQSSWGPGICIPAKSESHARSIAELIPTTIDGANICIQISEPMNIGASVRSSAPETHISRFA